LVKTHTWVRDIQGALSGDFFTEYLALWDLISEVMLQPEVEDSRLKFSGDGQYSAKSSYESLFHGTVIFSPYDRIWETCVPGKCCFFHIASGP
jgi:hypothetical protein